MQWNNLSYEMQQKVYQRLEKTLLEEQDVDIQDALVAAIEELEQWDNSPCAVQIYDGIFEQPYVSEAQEVALCCDCLISWFCHCSCHKKEL